MRIRGIKPEKFYEVVSYVANKAGISLRSLERDGINSNISREVRQNLAEIDRVIEGRQRQKREKYEITTFYDDSILNFFDKTTFYQGWVDEGISFESMEKFGISWYESQKHIIIPHRNIDGKLVGIRRRSLKPEDSHCKYMPEYIGSTLYDHPLGLNLYGFYENQKAIKRYKRAIIVEAEKSVLLSDTYYGDKSCTVATCGFNVSDWQINALLKLGVEDIYLAYDKDFDVTKADKYRRNRAKFRDFNHYRERLKNLCLRIAPYCNTYVILDKRGLLEEKDSPLDKGKEVFDSLMADRQLIKLNNK